MSSILKKLSIFKNLTDKDLSRIEKLVRVDQHETGHVLFRQGDTPDAFYIVEQGAVRIVRHDDGQSRELGILEDGDFFGEMGVIEDSPRTADAILAKNSRLLSIDKAEFQHFMAINPSISMKIMALMARRYRAKPSAATKTTQQQAQGVVIGIFSATGGVGNSFITSNLAVTLKQVINTKVLVIDLDLMFGDQAGIFNVRAPDSLAEVHDQTELDEDMIWKIIQTTQVGVDLIQSPPRPEESELVTPDLVRVVIEVVRPHYDYIILDTANAIQDLAITLLEEIDRGYYILTPEVLSIKNAHRWLKIVDMINLSTNGIDLVLNKSTQADEPFHQAIEEQLRKKISSRLTYDLETTRRALNSGKFLATDFPDSPLTPQFAAIAHELTGLSSPPQQTKKSFWGRLLGT